MLILLIGCAVFSIIMIIMIIYTIATGQFHALPKEFLILFIPAAIIIRTLRILKKSNIDAEDKLNNNESISNTIKSTNISDDARIKENLPKVNKPEQIGDHTIKYKYDGVDVCIIKGSDPNLNEISVGDKVELIHEPENVYDNKAVMLKVNNIKIGYLYKGRLQDMFHDLQNELLIYSCISNIEIENNKVQIFLGFYRPLILEYGQAKNYYKNSKIFKLTGNKNVEMQGNLECCSDEESIEIEYDYEKEKYSAEILCGSIGYFPVSANELLKDIEYSQDNQVYIESVEDNDNDKYDVTVIVFT